MNTVCDWRTYTDTDELLDKCGCGASAQYTYYIIQEVCSWEAHCSGCASTTGKEISRSIASEKWNKMQRLLGKSGIKIT